MCEIVLLLNQYYLLNIQQMFQSFTYNCVSLLPHLPPLYPSLVYRPLLWTLMPRPLLNCYCC